MIDIWITRSLRARPILSALAHIGLGILAVIFGVHIFATEWGLPPQSLLQALGIYSGIGILVAIQLPNHVLHPSFGIANRITLIRAIIVSILAGMVGHSSAVTESGLWLMLFFAAASLTLDGIDGWVARRLHIQSMFGACFDMEVDAAFILVLAVLTWELEKVGGWVLLAGAMRYLFMIAGLPMHAFRRPLPPSRRRQIACVTQTMALLFALCPSVGPMTASILTGAALFFLIISFGRDVSLLLTATPSAGDHS